MLETPLYKLVSDRYAFEAYYSSYDMFCLDTRVKYLLPSGFWVQYPYIRKENRMIVGIKVLSELQEEEVNDDFLKEGVEKYFADSPYTGYVSLLNPSKIDNGNIPEYYAEYYLRSIPNREDNLYTYVYRDNLLLVDLSEEVFYDKVYSELVTKIQEDIIHSYYDGDFKFPIEKSLGLPSLPEDDEETKDSLVVSGSRKQIADLGDAIEKSIPRCCRVGFYPLDSIQSQWIIKAYDYKEKEIPIPIGFSGYVGYGKPLPGGLCYAAIDSGNSYVYRNIVFSEGSVPIETLLQLENLERLGAKALPKSEELIEILTKAGIKYSEYNGDYIVYISTPTFPQSFVELSLASGETILPVYEEGEIVLKRI